MEGCGPATITGRGARDGDRVAGRGVGGVVVGPRSRVLGMRAQGLEARAGGETEGGWGEGFPYLFYPCGMVYTLGTHRIEQLFFAFFRPFD